MKKILAVSIKLAFIALAAICFASVSFGQAKSITKEESNEKINNAFSLSDLTFPRRETEVRPNEREVYEVDEKMEDGEMKLVEIILSETKIKEFETKDRIRYEFIKVTKKGKSVTKRVQIGSFCYDSDGSKWNTKGDCDISYITTVSKSAKEEFFLENVLLDSKPTLTYRLVKTGKIYSDGEPPYINEYVYYIDALGRIIKTEHLTKQGDSPSVLQNSVKYDYDITVKPIKKPIKISRKTKR